MADISKIQTLDGTTYDIKDTTARNLIPTNISDLTNDSGFITGMEILSYGSSTWNDFITAYNAKKVVYCRASSNSNPASGSQTRLAFMAYVNNATNPTSVEFQYYRSVSSHSDSQQGDQVFVYELVSTGTWSVKTRNTFTKIAAGTNMTSSYADGTLTLNATGGGGTSDYDDLTDKPSINNVTLSGNKTAAELGLAAASDIPTVPVQSVNGKTGAVVLDATDVGAYSKPSTGIPQTDLAQTVQNKLDQTVVISDTQPTATENKLWVDTDAGSGASYQIPTVAEMEAADAQTAAEIGIVITGARPSMTVTAGQYVIVRNSTISGVTDGLYTANTALSPSTDVTAANLLAVSGGGLNGLLSKIEQVSTASLSITKLVSSGTLDSRTCVKKGNVVTVGGRIYGMTNNDGSQRAYFQIPEGFRPTVQDAKCMGAVKVLTSTNTTFPTVPILVPTMVTIAMNGQVLFGGGQFTDCTIDQVLFAGTYVV